MKNLEELEKERLEVVNKSKKFRIFGIICLIPAIALVVWGLLSDNEFNMYPLVGGIALLIIAFGLIGYGEGLRRKFISRIKSELMPSLMAEALETTEFTYEKNSGISLSTILSPGIYQRPDRYSLSDYLSCKYNGIPYQMCFACLEEEHQYTDKDGHTRTTYETYFKGKVIVVDFKRKINTAFAIIEGHPKGLNVRGLNKIETEVSTFNKKFKSYCTDNENFFYFMTPSLINKIMELESKFGGTLQIVMDGDLLYVFINDSRRLFDINLNNSFVGENNSSLAQIKGETLIPAAIINEFHLDSDKFNKEKSLS